MTAAIDVYKIYLQHIELQAAFNMFIYSLSQEQTKGVCNVLFSGIALSEGIESGRWHCHIVTKPRQGG